MASEIEMNLKCAGCKKSYRLGPANTIVHYFSDRVYCSYLESTCPRPQCDTVAKNFVDTEDVVACIKDGWPIVPEGHAPQEVLDQWCEIADVALINPVDLTPRLEKMVDVLRWELEGEVTVQDILDVPIETRLPRRWQ